MKVEKNKEVALIKMSDRYIRPGKMGRNSLWLTLINRSKKRKMEIFKTI